MPLSHAQQSGPWVRTNEPLLWLTSCGHEMREGTDYFFDARKRSDRPHIVIQLTLGGCGFYANRRGRVVLGPGKAFIDMIPGKFSYGYAIESRSAYELVFLSMGGAVVERWQRRIVEAFGNVLELGATGHAAALMLSIARGSGDGSLGDRYVVSARLYELLMSIFSSLNRSRIAADTGLSAALALVEERGNLTTFNVSSLADAVGCSREHLSRRFRAAMGVSPVDYLMQHRLGLAARVLRGDSDKLESIARRCGFSGANYLCRAFRKRFGVTPTQFRSKPWLAAW